MSKNCIGTQFVLTTSAVTRSAVIATMFVLSACSTHQTVPSSPSPSSQSSLHTILDKPDNHGFKQQFQTWQGTPYRYGGNSKQGVDCSAFVQLVYLEAHQKSLPRTTAQQSSLGYKVKLNEATSGDLVFFKTSHKTRHVGIYLGDDKFMHASTSKGVIISRLDNPYWSSVFWQVRRID